VIPNGVIDAPPAVASNCIQRGYVYACLHSREMLLMLWRSHLRLPCPLRAKDVGDAASERAGGLLLYLQFLVMYAIMRSEDIESRARESLVSLPSGAHHAAQNCLLIVDNRPSMLSLLALLVTSINLAPGHWEVCVVCTKGS
jgi:hypothetical protein